MSTKTRLVYESLREEIVQGQLQPGARLVFSRLAERFGVSPIPVREAVRQLETEGLVELKPHTRVEVTALPWNEGIWVSEMRLALEPVAAREATPLVSDDQLSRTSWLLDEMRNVLDAGDYSAFTERYFEFHDVLYEATPNRRMVATILELRETSKRFHRVYRCESVLRTSENDLRRIWRLVRWRDQDAVFEAVREHRARSLSGFIDLATRAEQAHAPG